MSDTDKQFQRIEAIISQDEDLDYEACRQAFFKHLQAHLQLPCEVNGIEDFGWEERYIIGGWDDAEYEKLKKTQPSYKDTFQLLKIELEPFSKWMLYRGDDIPAHVQRISDGKKFVLGLSELKTVDNNSLNAQLLDDFAVFVGNYR